MVDGTPTECSFCGASREQRKTVIAGPRVLICDVCVVLCVDICAERRGQSPAEWIADPDTIQPEWDSMPKRGECIALGKR
jgi:ATP-dependent protease Clp ATPase subunit